MTYRSMKKTAPDKIKNIEESNPENRDIQSIENNAYNESAIIAELKQEKADRELNKTLF